jgi:hypothetical protein
MGFSRGRRPRVNNPHVILAAVGMGEKQEALLAGCPDRDGPLLVQGMIWIVERQRERIGEHSGRFLE